MPVGPKTKSSSSRSTGKTSRQHAKPPVGPRGKSKTNTTKKSTSKPTGLHPRNLHQGRYDFAKLEQASPKLTQYVIRNPRGEKSVNFSDPQAVLALNEALLKAYYGLEFWQIPQGYLCPPIPGRADYIHHLADLIASTERKVKALDTVQENNSSSNHKHSLLDIGTGANCIYPILGSTSYDWNFVASDIDPVSIKTAQLLVQSNKKLKGKIKVRHQTHSNHILHSIIQSDDLFIATVCNPPFHESLEKARQGSLRKVNNLNKGKTAQLSKRSQPVLNFAGTANELCCKGGEIAFLKQMASESNDYSQQVCWFTSLVSKKENVPLLQQLLKKLGVKECQVFTMAQGQKISRFVAWTFLTPAQQSVFFN
ncbi:23S rRNA (adenine(1618)-N(6))-methyltransferase RlmF [Vibrio gangliei]|uniref:23S rRNA (adenine(1618)-N(6))-methyltransferase RlmF n=1 Tax=Vibrio gangliei TaxID=2077090 RepID=UPI000D0128AB|nr:23S rRNA (adenine(1618)-N(6))-methyltransferase RlmF [Vibrio gangliei]